jgi:hypothetical protein
VPMRPGPERAIARVTLADRHAAGLAFVVDQEHMLTCAHVVNTALGRPLREASPPPPGVELTLEFEFGGTGDAPATATARIVDWWPPRGTFDHYDVARLRLCGPLPEGVTPLRLAPADPKLPLRVQMWGPVPGRTTGGHVIGQLMGGVAKGRYQIDQERYGAFRVVRGFSGGPVWQPDSGEVVGLLQASSVNDDTAIDAYLLGVEVLAVPDGDGSAVAGGAPEQRTEPQPSGRCRPVTARRGRVRVWSRRAGSGSSWSEQV